MLLNLLPLKSVVFPLGEEAGPTLCEMIGPYDLSLDPMAFSLMLVNFIELRHLSDSRCSLDLGLFIQFSFFLVNFVFAYVK